MNTELQNLTWSILPKEYREEVKKLYDRFLFTREGYYDELFGKHNLTSDAEGDEMLMVSRKEVMKHFREAKLDCIYYPRDSKDFVQAIGRKIILVRLFGKDKCLPDEEPPLKITAAEDCVRMAKEEMGIFDDDVDSLSQNPPENCDNGNLISTDDNKPAEPKFKVGDKVVIIANCKHQGEVAEIIHVDKGDPIYAYYLHNFSGEWYSEFDLEPYTEPDTSHETPVCENHSDNTSQKEVNVNSNRNLSKDCDKQFDNILKDSFSKERRLNVAVQMVKAIMQCPEAVGRIASAEADSLLDDILHDALYLTDRLIAECAKGGSHEKA